MLELRILLNSVISDTKHGVHFMSLDLKDYFLTTPMKYLELLKVQMKNFPSDVYEQYQLSLKTTSTDSIYSKIKKGMYSLK